MNVRLDYPNSGNSYSAYFSDFKVKITVTKGGRINVSFREQKEGGRPYASLSLPRKKARQLAHGMLTASGADIDPIEFSVDESVASKP